MAKISYHALKGGMRPTFLETVRERFPGDDDGDPAVGCAVAIWIHGSLSSSKPAIAQFRSQPNVAVIAVGNYGQDKIQQLLDHALRPVLVFDDQSNLSEGWRTALVILPWTGKLMNLRESLQRQGARSNLQRRSEVGEGNSCGAEGMPFSTFLLLQKR